MRYEVEFLENEYFWGGATNFGTDMPVSAESVYNRDFTVDPRNQMMPLYISSKGRYIWSEDTFRVWIENRKLCFEGSGFELKKVGETLRQAYLGAMRDHFPFTGKSVPKEFFTTAQYNTWMEYTYHPTQEKVLDYAHNIIDHGFEPGILIIDEGWHGRYGMWEWDRAAFPDPAAMTAELHALGFKIMLWVTPNVCPDGQDFILRAFPRFGHKDSGELFLRNKQGEVAIVKWWNGYSAILDLRKECDREFLDGRLKILTEEYGIDGFKFDGGSFDMYHPSSIINGEARPDHDPAEMNIAWNRFGERYRFHEYKDTFKGGGRATVQRLCDRGHLWEGDGINTLIPCSILQGLMGHPFICPDMIGGGEWSFTVKPGFKIDEELFIRMAQASALCPMMQFSWAPWRALSEKSYRIVAEAGRLHKEMSDIILKYVSLAESTGEPVLRCLEYNFPGCGYEKITDQFMIGDEVLVCPVVTKGTTEKDVVLPAGNWRSLGADKDRIYAGGQALRMSTPLSKLLYFTKA